MSPVGHGTPGKARVCPHCRATILESASICPVCHHHLRFDPHTKQRAIPSFSPLRVEGTIRHPVVGEPWEYSVLVSIRDDHGKEVARHVVGVGALHPDERRTVTLAVEVFTPGAARTVKPR